jgi:hypothetical protein
MFMSVGDSTISGLHGEPPRIGISCTYNIEAFQIVGTSREATSKFDGLRTVVSILSSFFRITTYTKTWRWGQSFILTKKTTSQSRVA